MLLEVDDTLSFLVDDSLAYTLVVDKQALVLGEEDDIFADDVGIADIACVAVDNNCFAVVDMTVGVCRCRCIDYQELELLK